MPCPSLSGTITSAAQGPETTAVTVAVPALFEHRRRSAVRTPDDLRRARDGRPDASGAPHDRLRATTSTGVSAAEPVLMAAPGAASRARQLAPIVRAAADWRPARPSQRGNRRIRPPVPGA